MDTSLAPFWQVLRKVCMFKPPQSREPFPGHCYSKALSRDSVPMKLSYLLAHTSNWGILEHSRILTPWATHCWWFYPHDFWSLWVGGVPIAWGPHPHEDHLGRLNIGTIRFGCHSGVPLVPMVFWAFFMERCTTVWGLAFRMHLWAWKIMMFDWHFNLKWLSFMDFMDQKL